MHIHLDMSCSMKDLSFWTPTKILYNSNDLSRISRLEQILITFFELADKFCYVGLKNVEFKPYLSGQDWLYRPNTTVREANLLNIIERIAKIFAFIILAPITLFAFGMKYTYKRNCLYSILQQSIINFLCITKVTDDELRALKLPKLSPF